MRKGSDDVRLRSVHVRQHSDDMRLRSDDVRLRSDDVRLRSDDVRLLRDGVRSLSAHPRPPPARVLGISHRYTRLPAGAMDAHAVRLPFHASITRSKELS